MIKILPEPFDFEWDKGNIDKNKKHNVGDKETEEAFFDGNKVMFKDVFHSKIEDRFVLLGKTSNHRLFYIIYTKRGKKVRIISARDINKKEVQLYEKEA